MRTFEAPAWAIIYASGQDARVKIPYHFYLRLSRAARFRLKLLAHFDEDSKMWQVESEDLEEIIRMLMEEGFQISLVGKRKGAVETLREKIKQAELWCKKLRERPELAFIKSTRVREKDGRLRFDKNGRVIWYFQVEKTPEEVLRLAEKVVVEGSRKSYTLFRPTEKAFRCLREKYMPLVEREAEKAIEKYEKYIKEQRALMGPLTIS